MNTSPKNRKPDPKNWAEVARRVLDWDYADADGSLRESIIIGLRDNPNPEAVAAVERLKKKVKS